jgi:hypothetical protein
VACLAGTIPTGTDNKNPSIGWARARIITNDCARRDVSRAVCRKFGLSAALRSRGLFHPVRCTGGLHTVADADSSAARREIYVSARTCRAVDRAAIAARVIVDPRVCAVSRDSGAGSAGGHGGGVARCALRSSASAAEPPIRRLAGCRLWVSPAPRRVAACAPCAAPTPLLRVYFRSHRLSEAMARAS